MAEGGVAVQGEVASVLAAVGTPEPRVAAVPYEVVVGMPWTQSRRRSAEEAVSEAAEGLF